MAKLNIEKATKPEVADWLAKRLAELPVETLKEFARRVQDGEVDLEAAASSALPPSGMAQEIRPDQPAGGATAAAPVPAEQQPGTEGQGPAEVPPPTPSGAEK